MYTTLVLASLLPFLASGKPITPRQTETTTTASPFGLIAAHSTSPIHLQTVNANGQRFWIGKNTTTYCPISDCPPGTATELVASDGYAAMNVEVPGGQQVLVLPTGQLSYTQAHSGNTYNGTLSPFAYNAPSDPSSGSLGTFTFNGDGFLACPDPATGAAPWLVFAAAVEGGVKDADVPGGSVADCIGFSAIAPVDTQNGGSPAAWQYI